MKRGLVFTLCALALAAYSTSASAQAPTVSLSLNLRYTDPADPTEGGRWYLVAKTSDPEGISAISAYISNIDTAGMAYGNGAGAGSAQYAATTAATIGALLNGGNPYAATIGGAVNVVYGQDTANGPIILDVGQGTGTPGNTVNDPLRNNATWGNAAIIASGSFSGARPAFVTAGGNTTDANTHAENDTTPPNNQAQDAATTAVVRGDSINTAGLGDNLRRGDHNRDFAVNGNDLDIVLFNFNTSGKTWDQGDSTDDGNVNGNDLDNVLFNFNTTQTPPAAPAVGGVPEPATVTLAVLGLGALGLLRRRK